MKRVAGVVAATSLLITACSTAPSSDPTPTPTTQGASIEQFASVIAQYDSAIRPAADVADTCIIDMALDAESALSRQCRTKAEKARAAIITIGEEFKSLGPSPDEIFKQTYAMLEAWGYVTEEERDVPKHCKEPASDACMTAVNGINLGVKEVVVPQLDAWKPYIS